MKLRLLPFLLIFFSGSLLAADLSKEEFLELISFQMGQHYNVKGDWQIDLNRDVSIPPATEDIEVLSFPTRPASAMILRVRFLGPNGGLRETNVSVRAQLWGEAWMAAQPLTRGHPFDASQLDLQRLDLLRENNAVTIADTKDGDFIFARSIPAGRVVNWRDLQRRPIVQRGQVVEVAAVDSGLSVILKAMALENGAAGDMIRVRNMQSNREIGALVVGEGRAEIRF